MSRNKEMKVRASWLSTNYLIHIKGEYIRKYEVRTSSDMRTVFTGCPGGYLYDNNWELWNKWNDKEGRFTFAYEYDIPEPVKKRVRIMNTILPITPLDELGKINE